jgi:hypothetical protein
MVLCSVLRRPAGLARGNRMKKLAVGFVILIQMFSVLSAYSRQDESTRKERPVVICRVWAEVKDFSQRDRAFLHVSLENTSARDVIVKGIEIRLNGLGGSDRAALRGSQRSYVSWVDPESKSPLKVSLDSRGQLAYSEKKLTLQATKNVEFTLDLAKLEWTDEFSSAALPGGTLYAVVPAGTYEIQVNVNGENSYGHLKIESNKPKIEIHRPSE